MIATSDWQIVEIWEEIWLETVQEGKAFPVATYDVLMEFGFDSEQSLRLSKQLIAPQHLGRLARVPNYVEQAQIENLIREEFQNASHGNG